MKEIIKQTEENLNILKENLRKNIKEKGPSKIATITGTNKNYLSDWIYGRVKKISYEKILYLLKKIYKIT
jgi:hypothetical protein